MRALGEPDAFPSADLGLLRSSGLATPRELERRAEAWRPWRAYAAMYLWNAAGKSSDHPSTLVPSRNPKLTVEGVASHPASVAV
jgi:3-methyladenine DNA glycosylase/8-oxoguanine DNA glycosylase